MVVEKKRGWGKQLDRGILLIYGKARVTNSEPASDSAKSLPSACLRACLRAYARACATVCTQEPIQEPQQEGAS